MTAIYDNETPDANECFAKFIKAKKAFGKTVKNATNPHFKNRYADLSCVLEAVTDSLNENGLMVTQIGEKVEGDFVIRTMVFDENGHSIDFGITPIKTTKDDAQGFGSGLTYARRYGLMTAFGLAPEDDDGNLASVAPSQKDVLIAQVKKLGNECLQKGYTTEDVQKALLGVPSADLSEAQATKGVEALQALIQAKKV